MRNSILFFVILIPSIVWPETSVNITGGSVGKAMISPPSLSTGFSFNSGMDESKLNMDFIEPHTWFDQSVINPHDDISISEFPFFNQIESIRLIDGTIIQADDLTDIDVLGNKLTANHPIEFQAMIGNKNFGYINQHRPEPARWSHDHQEGTFVSGIDTIRNYQRFLNRYLETGEIGNDYAGFHDVNIYHRFIEENREVLDEEKLKTLFSYWHTNFSSPAQLPRYQYNSDMDWQDADNFNWHMIQEDIKEAMLEWSDINNNLSQNSEDFVNNLEDGSFAYQYGDRVFINPFNREITEVWTTEGSVLDMPKVQEMMKAIELNPSMIDLPRQRIQNIILEDGREIYFDDFKSLGELSSQPASFDMEKIEEQWRY